jgi:hypothetical protein
VGDLGRGLAQQQALLGRGGEEPAAPAFEDQRLVIQGRLEPQQADPEAVLAGGLAVAAAGVAPELREDRDDLVGEVDRLPGRELPDRHRHPGLPLADADADGRPPIAVRLDGARGVDGRHRRVGAGEPGLGGPIRALGPVDRQLLDRVGPPQDNLGRRDPQLRPGPPLRLGPEPDRR